MEFIISTIGLILVLAVLTFNGLTIFNLLDNSKNKLLKLGGAMIIGPLTYFLLLSFTSYFLKGYWGIRIVFILFSISCLYLYRKNSYKINLRYLFLVKKNLENLITFVLLIIYSLIILRFLPFAGIGPEAYVYTGITSSFARGNYPTVLPWQPDFLTVYHQGAFITGGGIHAIFNTNLGLMYYGFSGFLVLAIIFFLTGITREKYRGILCLLPSILGLFVVGGPLIPLSLDPNILSSLKLLASQTSFSNLKGFVGGGPTSLSDFIFIYFTTFGLATLLIFFYLITKINSKNILLKYLILITLTILTIAIDEEFLPIQLFFLVIFFILDLRKKTKRTLIKNLSILLISGLILFMTIQNPVRDSFLTPSPDGPRFSFFLPHNPKVNNNFTSLFIPNSYSLINLKIDENKLVAFSKEVNKRFEKIESASKINDKNTWYLLDLKILIILTILAGFYFRSGWSLIFAVSSVVSLIFGLLVTNNFWYPNYVRFFDRSYQFAVLSIGFLIVHLITSKSKPNKIFAAILLISFIPQLTTSHAAVINPIINSTHGDILNNYSIDESFKKVQKLVPVDKRIIYFDGFPMDGTSSFMTTRAMVNFGQFVPVGPLSSKVIMTEDNGIEWLDAMAFLDPNSFKSLKVDYVYVLSTAEKFLPEERKNQLENSQYFDKLHTDRWGNLYKVNLNFKNISDNFRTFKKALEQIPDGKTVYLDNFQSPQISRPLILELSRRTNLFGYPHSVGGGNYMYIEKFLPYHLVCNNCPEFSPINTIQQIDYILADPTTDPKLIRNHQYELLAQLPKVNLWKRIAN